MYIYQWRLFKLAPGVFIHISITAHCLRLEKLLYIGLSRSSNGYFKSLLDPGGGFNSETAVRPLGYFIHISITALSRSSSEYFKPFLDPGGGFNSETAVRRCQK